ncbi:transmembrane protein 6/97 [Naematelia encephala]|uniref:Efficient mitochondria targeting-associated protein 19 n=1 Tax=Naematelia encephala TaxID=71784 RepID=A0A1Y2BA64_9TREE|nr:transmembrane protein 6/97 [Naematelia encephala]
MGRFTGRRVDQAYFAFFIIHLIASLALDLQRSYPAWLIDDTQLAAFKKWYISWSRDPVMLNAYSGDPAWLWIEPFFFLELVFQVPSFVVGAIGLWKNDKRVYPLMLAYAASTATTMLPTVQSLYTAPSNPPLSSAELYNLFASYLPFLIVTLGMAVDMTVRLTHLVGDAQRNKVKVA